MPTITIQRAGNLSPLKKLVNERELSALLGVSATHLGNLRKRRVLPYLLLGKAVRYSPDDVALALEFLTVRPPKVQT
jgi:hypothetical protein